MADSLLEELVVGSKVLLNDTLGFIVLSNSLLELVHFLVDPSPGLEALDVQFDLAFVQFAQSFLLALHRWVRADRLIQLLSELSNALAARLDGLGRILQGLAVPVFIYESIADI